MRRNETAPSARLTFSERDLEAHGILSRTTRWLLRRQGRFPEPRSIGGRRLYLGAEIRRWLVAPEAWRTAEE